MPCFRRSSCRNWWWWWWNRKRLAKAVQVSISFQFQCHFYREVTISSTTSASARLHWKKWWTCLRGTRAANDCTNRLPRYEQSGWENNLCWGISKSLGFWKPQLCVERCDVTIYFLSLFWHFLFGKLIYKWTTQHIFREDSPCQDANAIDIQERKLSHAWWEASYLL